MSDALALVDAHVHVYPEFDAGTLLDCAAANFSAAARALGAPRWQGYLLLTETARDHWFDACAGVASATAGRWALELRAGSDVTLDASRDGDRLVIVAGRQIVTAEKLELHALATRERFVDGAPAQEVLGRIAAAGAQAVLPWGVGKWTGPRRSLARALLGSAPAGVLLPSDNGGRPWFWSEPLLGAGPGPALRGSDPLPLPGEERRTGSAGSCFRRSDDGLLDGRGLVAALRSQPRDGLRSFGPAEGLARFIRNQTALRLRRRAPS